MEFDVPPSNVEEGGRAALSTVVSFEGLGRTGGTRYETGFEVRT